MAYTIVWTNEANKTLHDLTDFLAEQWSFKVVTKFVDAVYHAVDTLAMFPELGVVSNHELGIRFLTIKPYTKLYYRFDINTVTLIEFIDTRQELDGRFQ